MVGRFLAWRWAAALVSSPALAAGGAHIIDDAAVETPGVCHLDSWVTRVGHGNGLLDLAPACTRRASPNLEVGAFLDQGLGSGTTTVGLAPKLLLRSEDSGVGLGVRGGFGYSFGRDRIETAEAIGLVTLPARSWLRINANLGWQWTRMSEVHALFVGAQAEIALAAHLGIMVEGFTRDIGKAGTQAGVRWTPRDAITVDLLGGRYLDGRTPTAVTLGLTLRH